MDAHFDVCTLETMRSRIMGMEDEVYGDKVQVVDVVFVEWCWLVEAMLQTVHMGRDEGIAR
jgi:hypothetical protein